MSIKKTEFKIECILLICFVFLFLRALPAVSRESQKQEKRPLDGEAEGENVRSSQREKEIFPVSRTEITCTLFAVLSSCQVGQETGVRRGRFQKIKVCI